MYIPEIYLIGSHHLQNLVAPLVTDSPVLLVLIVSGLSLQCSAALTINDHFLNYACEYFIYLFISFVEDHC